MNLLLPILLQIFGIIFATSFYITCTYFSLVYFLDKYDKATIAMVILIFLPIANVYFFWKYCNLTEICKDLYNRIKQTNFKEWFKNQFSFKQYFKD